MRGPDAGEVTEEGASRNQLAEKEPILDLRRCSLICDAGKTTSVDQSRNMSNTTLPPIDRRAGSVEGSMRIIITEVNAWDRSSSLEIHE